MSGQGGFYRNGSSLTRSLQNELESDVDHGNYLDLPHTPYDTSTPHSNFQSPGSGSNWPLRPNFPTNLSMQDTSTHTLSSKIDQMMSMLSNTQQLLFSQQNAHSVLERKVEALSQDVSSLTDKLENATHTGGNSDKKTAPRAQRISSELSVSSHA